MGCSIYMTRKQKAEQFRLAFILASHITGNYCYDIGVRPKIKIRAIRKMLMEEANFQYNFIYKRNHYENKIKKEN